MLSSRTGTILKSIVEKYITGAAPVPSQNIASDTGFKVSPATIRNEMAYLEHEGYIIRPHTSAGSIPSDKGYRYYVESLEKAKLSAEQQFFINHLFHQVEREVEKWRSLAATLLSQLVQNVAVVSTSRPAHCKFKHMEMVSLQDSVVLLVLVLMGAKVKQKLINFDQALSQLRLTAIANKLNAEYSGLTSQQILAKNIEFSHTEQQITEYTVEVMRAEDEQEPEEPYLDGLYFILNQPEFARNDRLRNLIELVEHRNLLKVIMPTGLSGDEVQVVIGEENKAEAIRNYSVVISQYGLPDGATGTIGVVGPTRMPYAHTIPSVGYLSTVLSELMARLYGKETPPD
ncbi:heat-inducible transcriptional repressor HrcA [Chloroflexota bacterium]